MPPLGRAVRGHWLLRGYRGLGCWAASTWDLVRVGVPGSQWQGFLQHFVTTPSSILPWTGRRAPHHICHHCPSLKMSYFFHNCELCSIFKG